LKIFSLYKVALAFVELVLFNTLVSFFETKVKFEVLFLTSIEELASTVEF